MADEAKQQQQQQQQKQHMLASNIQTIGKDIPNGYEGTYLNMSLYKTKLSQNQQTYCFSSVTTDTAVKASSPVVGSSKNSICGSVISSIPMLVRFLSPPDTPRKNSFPT